MVPFDSEELKGIVYVWVGSRADHTEAQLAEQIAYKMYKVCKLFPVKMTFGCIQDVLSL